MSRSGKAGASYVLTEEGMRYLGGGLPEENLLKLCKDGMDIVQAQGLVKDFSIALMWAKKEGLVSLEKGKLAFARKQASFPVHDALEMISAGKDVDAKMLSLLVTRNLIRKGGEGMADRAMRLAGQEVSGLTPELIKTGMWRKVRFKPYDVRITGEKLHPGKRQPYSRFLSEVRGRLVEMGFKEMDGPIIEMEFWNFDALFQPQNHPSRDWTQTYTLRSPKEGALPDKRIVERVKAAHENGWQTGSTGWGYEWDPAKAAKLMPRAHGTACSARQLAKGVEVPGKYFAIKRCFRPDVIDATHGVEFNQCEGIIVGESLNFREMLGVLKSFALEIAGAEEVRFNADYYPFTEPSVQMSAKHPVLGWIEFAGAGIFRPELTMPLGVNHPVLAWGLGIDRLAMFKLGINDIRQLFSQDIDWLRRQKITV